MSKRPGCEDYDPSQDFAEPMPGDNPQAIGEFVKAVRAGIEKSINFPAAEHEALLQRLETGKDIYTTRIAQEMGKYLKGETLTSPFGRLVVVDVRPLTNARKNHPFSSDLTPEQLELLDGVPGELVQLRGAGREKAPESGLSMWANGVVFGDDPEAITDFVKAVREGIKKGAGEAQEAQEAPAGTQPKEPEESPPTSQRGLWASCFLVLAAVGVWFYYGPLAGLACLAPVAVLEAYRIFKTAYRTRMELTPQEEEFIAALSRGEEVKQ